MGAIADGARSGRGSDLGKAALKTIVTNRDLYNSYLAGMEKTSPEMAAKLRGEIDPLLTEIDAIDGLTPGRKEKSVELLYDIRTVESKLASIVEPTLRKPYEDKLVELRKQLGNTVQVPTDVEGEPLEGEELQAIQQAAAQKKKDKEEKKAAPTPDEVTAAWNGQETVDEVIPDKDYDTFVNDNVVSPIIIETIAQKVRQNETLSLREQAILAEKGKDVESALKNQAQEQAKGEEAKTELDYKKADVENRKKDELSNFDESITKNGRLISDEGEVGIMQNADGDFVVTTSIPKEKSKPLERTDNAGWSREFKTRE